LLLEGQWLGAGWFHAKFVAVLAMTALHGLFARWVNEFQNDRNRHSQKFFRIINEIPTALLIVIVILVVVKPF
jgi:protoporphyrinogen IX oxidase